MALYVYIIASGELYSWSPNDTDQVAPAAQLAAQGMAVVTGLPPLDSSHAWNAATKTVVSVTPPTPPNFITTWDFIMAFTAAELAAIRADTADNNIQQFLFALTVTGGVNLNASSISTALNYLVSKSLLTSARATAILATVSSGSSGGGR